MILGLSYALLGEIRAGRGADPTSAYETAIAAFGEALGWNPGYALAYDGRGNARRSLGEWRARRGSDPTSDYEAAVADLGEAVARSPGNWRAQAGRGLVLMLMSRYEEAVEALQEAYGVSKDPGLAAQLARARALAAQASSPAALLAEGRSLCEAGRWEEGLAALAEAAEAAPGDPNALNGYAWFLATCPEEDLTDPAAALPYAEKAAAILRELRAASPEDAALRATLAGTLDTLAECLWRAGEHGRAIEIQREAVELAPDSVELKEKLRMFETERPEEE